MFNINNGETTISEDSLLILYSANNIDYDLMELFNDFSQSLILLISNTYLGDEIMNNEDKINHFNWCWSENISNFKEEGICFEHTESAHKYYLEFMINFFYIINKKEGFDEIVMTNRIIFISLFTYGKTKTHNEVNNFFKIYTLLEKSLKICKKT